MASSNCIFCRIAAKEIPAEIVHESAEVVVFRDVRPQAPTHLLVIPRRHVVGLAEFSGLEAAVMSAVRAAATKTGIEKSGFRIVVNQGDDAGQEVPHLHFHVLGGRKLAWPPG